MSFDQKEFGGTYQQIATKTADYTAQASDNLILVDTTSGNVTITLPTPIGLYGNTKIRVVKTSSDSNRVNIAAAAGNLRGQANIMRQWEHATFESDGVGNWYQTNWNGVNFLAQAITPGATPTLDPRLGNIFTLTPGENETINASTGGFAGQEITLIVLTSGVSSYTLTFGTNFKSTATLATGTTTGKYFVVKFVSDGTRFYEISRTAAQ